MATQAEIGAHLDLSDRHVRELAKKGVIPQSKGRGGLDVDACRVAYIRYLRSVASGHRSQDGELDLTEERAKLAKAQTETAEIRNAVARGELVPARAVLEHWAAQVVSVRTHLRSVPHQLKGAVPHLTPDEVLIARRLIDRACTELADGLPERASDDQPKDGGEVAATA